MKIKLLTLVTLCSYVLAYNYHCSKHATLLLAKKPSYDFSVKILQRITEETDSHFVYSPLSTWLELSALAEGATGATRQEIWRVTKYHKNRCFRKKLGDILNKLKKDLNYEIKRQTVIAMDELMKVNNNYIHRIKKLYGIKVMVLNFDDGNKSAAAVNSVIGHGTGGVVDDIVYYDDFDSRVLLISDANYFRSRWIIPFDSALTKLQPFYATNGLKIGEVSMMNQVGYFNLIDFPFLESQILEIPCVNRRISMLVFLPKKNRWIGELFHKLPRTRLTSIFNMYKRQEKVLVNVTMPKFKQRTELDNLAELVYDMGIRRIFDPKLADLKDISNYKMSASLMTQITNIEINEKGITASANFLIKNNTSIEFLVNKPFAYMIVDKDTDFILFAGVYSKPSVV